MKTSNSHTHIRNSLAVIGLLLVIAQPLRAQVTSVFFEPFDYANQAALMSVWTKADTTVSTPNIASNAAVPDSPYLTAPNSLISRSLGTTISASTDWTLSFDMILTAYQRGGWVGLFDADSTNGYIALWDSGNSASGPSTFSIRSYSSASPLTTWNPSLTSLKSLSVAHDLQDPIFNESTNSDFVTVTLAWNALDQTLTLGTNIAGTSSVSTTALAGIDVSNIFIRGNTTVYVDNVDVSVIPESASFAVVGGVIVLLWVCGRRFGRKVS